MLAAQVQQARSTGRGGLPHDGTTQCYQRGFSICSLYAIYVLRLAITATPQAPDNARVTALSGAVTAPPPQSDILASFKHI
jgi:hypothetical protein